MGTYNGWSNYNTWRINIEFFTNTEHFKGNTAEDLKQLVDNFLLSDCENYTTYQLALIFLEEVNWKEIEEAVNE